MLNILHNWVELQSRLCLTKHYAVDICGGMEDLQLNLAIYGRGWLHPSLFTPGQLTHGVHLVRGDDTKNP